MTDRRHRQAGFTLVEAIVVIVITGIVASFVAVFIRLPVQSYVETTARIALADAADTALNRINRELRLALPNSVVASTTAVQFVLTKAGGRYVDVSNLPPATIQPLQFNVANPAFDMVGPAPTGRAAILPGDFIVINNTGFAPANVYATTRNNVATVANVTTTATGATRIALNGTLGTSSPSPFRFRVAMGTVTYVCQNNQLVRYFTPSIPTTGLAAAGLGRPSVLAERALCVFDSTILPTQAGTSLVTAKLTMSSPTGETVSLIRQTQVENLP
jgi:MSHA biogenesis protein MshO